MPFLKKDLKNPHYSWSANSGSLLYSGQPSRRLFDRDNGDQVLFIINAYESETNALSPVEGQRIEQMIMNELPLDARSEISVLNWLKQAFQPMLTLAN
jgi:hypothetical protein